MQLHFYCLITIFLLQTSFAQETKHRLKDIQIKDSAFCLPVEDQSNSPTCWAFGTNAVIASDGWKINKEQINFSEMFIARYAYIDKASKYLATGGKTYFEGGGQFHDVIRVIQKFGIVPESVYTGKLLAQKQHDHAKLDTAMQHVVKQMRQKGKTKLDLKDTKRLNDTLNKYLGKVPESFIYEQKRFTPKSFAKEKVSFINDYVELVSFTNQKLYRKFILKDKFNWAADSFYNVSLSDLEQITDTALFNGWSLGWEGDVTNSWFNTGKGLAQMDSIPLQLEEKRTENYTKEITERDHMLQLVGAGKDTKDAKWYYLKNSWGNYNRYNGYLYMNAAYFKYNVVILFVHKNALPFSLKQKLNLN